MTAPTVGLALIARNEQDTLPTLLASVAGAFDQVVLVDTGSTDDTIRVFTEWAGRQTAPPGGRLEATHHRFEWTDDFSEPRNYADSLLTTDFLCWADCDDELVGALNLRALAAQAPPEVAAYVATYDYAIDVHGNVVCVLQRERLVRRGHGHWIGRVHEAQVIQGGSARVDPSVCKWVHRKRHVPDEPGGTPRNLRILRKWLKDEPNNPRVLGYLGTEEAARGNHAKAVGFYRKYLRQPIGWPEEAAQVHRKLAMSLLALGEREKARRVAKDALDVAGQAKWPDNYLSLAQVNYHLGDYVNAEHWARATLEMGPPETLLIVNPLDYIVEPRLCLAASLGAQGRHEEAIAEGEQVLQIVPNHHELQAHLGRWKGTVKREHAANTWAGCARMLLAHDEQLKALTLLEDTCPYFVTDHPTVVQLRSVVRERVHPLLDPAGAAEHYEGGTEDGMTVEFAAQLPRAHFARDQILEQIKEGA